MGEKSCLPSVVEGKLEKGLDGKGGRKGGKKKNKIRIIKERFKKLNRRREIQGSKRRTNTKLKGI